MNNYEYIFFDFDGTLVDTTNGTKLSALYALKQFNIDESSDEEIGRKFSGTILKNKFQEYGLNEEEALKAVNFYRDYQSKNTITCNEMYDGIEKVLNELKSKGKKLIVVTGKLEETSKKILEYMNILKYFDLVAGATCDSSRIKKNDIMEFAIKNFKNIDFDKCIMIGDRPTDVEAGTRYNMDTIGVLYGMGDKQSFDNLNVTYFINSPLEILNIVK